MTLSNDSGLVDLPSKHSFDETVEKFKAILNEKGITLFALIDHSGEAEKVGLKMLPTKLLVFGNPSVGTPLMVSAPRSAIDLPLKILVWEDAERRVWITYNSPNYVQRRYNLPVELLKNIAGIEVLAANAAV